MWHQVKPSRQHGSTSDIEERPRRSRHVGEGLKSRDFQPGPRRWCDQRECEGRSDRTSWKCEPKEYVFWERQNEHWTEVTLCQHNLRRIKSDNRQVKVQRSALERTGATMRGCFQANPLVRQAFCCFCLGWVCHWKPFWIPVGESFQRAYLEEWKYMGDDSSDEQGLVNFPARVQGPGNKGYISQIKAHPDQRGSLMLFLGNLLGPSILLVKN